MLIHDPELSQAPSIEHSSMSEKLSISCSGASAYTGGKFSYSCLGFYVAPIAKGIRRRDLGLKNNPDRLEKLGIERTIPGLQVEQLNHYTTVLGIW